MWKRYPNDRMPARYSIVFFDSFFSESFLGTFGAMLYGCSPAGGRFRAGYVCAAFSPFPPVPNALVRLAAVPVFLARAVFSPYRTGRFPCLPVHSRKRTAIAGAVPFGSYSIQGTRRACCGARRSPHPDCSGGIFFRTSSPVETFGSPRRDILLARLSLPRRSTSGLHRPFAPEELPRTAPFGSRSIRGSARVPVVGTLSVEAGPVVVIRFGDCRSLRRIPALSVYTARSTGIGDACLKAGGLGIRVSRKGVSFPTRLSCKIPKRAFGTPNRRLERYIRPVITGRTTVHKRKE